MFKLENKGQDGQDPTTIPKNGGMAADQNKGRSLKTPMKQSYLEFR